LSNRSKYDIIVDIGKRRGLFWPSYEIYGGVAGLYDFGPVGVEIKRRIMLEWLKFFIYRQDGLVVELESPVIMPRIVLVASGHEEHFTDPITECTKCGRVFRADHLVEEQAGVKAEGLSMDELWDLMKKHNVRCPVCGGELTKPRPALLLFKTEIGPYKGSPGYLRPEAAQGMFVSFKQVYNATRNRLPLGIAQVGTYLSQELLVKVWEELGMHHGATDLHTLYQLQLVLR
jgi:glycyl-tRNA synthetase